MLTESYFGVYVYFHGFLSTDGFLAALKPQDHFIFKLVMHWGSSHEGSGRHPRQHGGGCFRAAGRFALILRC